MSACFWIRIGSLTRTETLRRYQFIAPLISSRVCYSAKAGGKRETDKLVYLLDVEGKHLGTKLLTDASNIAKKGKWLLVCTDSTTKYPTYRLESKSAQITESKDDDSNSKDTRQTEKTRSVVIKNLVITTKVSDHDLGVKLDSAKKWLRHGNEVKVVVTGDKNTFDKIFAKISMLLKDYASLKQKQVGNSLRFLCVPKGSITADPETNIKSASSSPDDNLSDDLEDPNDIVNRELQQLLNTDKK